MGRDRPLKDDEMSPKTPILILSDEEDANADLSLGILAKAKRKKRPEDFVLDIASSDDEHRETETPQTRTLVVDLEGEPDVDRENTCVEASGDGVSLSQAITVEETGVAVLKEKPGFADGEGGASEDKKKKKKKKKKQKTASLEDDDQSQCLPLSMPEVSVAETKEVAENEVMRKLLRGPRYFDPPEEQELCYNCGEPGHRLVDCTVERHKKPCYVCGNAGHEARDCVQGLECFICKNVGHYAKNCPERSLKGERNSNDPVVCLLCGDVGHDMMSCRNSYRPEDLKEIQCYICNQFGHLCCIDVMDSFTRELSCYNCGAKGHTGQGCAKSRGGKGSAKICYRCGEEGHFARGCRRDDKLARWMPDSTDPANEWSQDDTGFFGFKSVPHDFGKLPRWTDMEVEGRKAATPGEFMSRNGRRFKYEEGSTGPMPYRMGTWESTIRTLGFGDWENGSGSGGQYSKPLHTPNSSHNSRGHHNKYSASKSRKRDGWRKSN